MNTKMTSTCCKAKAKMNLRDAGWFCTACGEPCSAKSERGGFGAKGSTLCSVRKVSGQRELFVQGWAKCGGRSEVSGEKLLPPEHPQFHFQGSHLLPKGSYPDYKLDPRNIVMMTMEEHETWHREPKGLLLADPKWAPIVARFKALQTEAHRKDRTLIEDETKPL